MDGKTQITVALLNEQVDYLLNLLSQQRAPLGTITAQIIDQLEQAQLDTMEAENEEGELEEEEEVWYGEDVEIRFADPGGNSALRAASRDNPRNRPCPTCKRPNLLTPADVALGYQCDRCADRAERGGDY